MKGDFFSSAPILATESLIAARSCSIAFMIGLNASPVVSKSFFSFLRYSFGLPSVAPGMREPTRETLSAAEVSAMFPARV